jgi:D-tyrosyl-tRNA(Tyr) deacylase
VKNASVSVDGKIVGKINRGIMLLIGIAETDTIDDVDFIANKCVNLRIFEDNEGKMNRSVIEERCEILAISQFTLLGNTRKGRRPSFIDAASPEKGRTFYDAFVERLKSTGLKVECGIFGAMMNVDLINYGPVTIILENKD